MGIILVQSSVSSAAQFATILLVFVFVLVITYFTTKFVGQYQKTQSYSKNFETIEAYRLNGNNHLQLIRMGKKYFVVAVSKDSVTSICELNEEDLDLDKFNQASLSSFSNLYTKAKGKFCDRGDMKNE